MVIKSHIATIAITKQHQGICALIFVVSYSFELKIVAIQFKLYVIQLEIYKFDDSKNLPISAPTAATAFSTSNRGGTGLICGGLSVILVMCEEVTLFCTGNIIQSYFALYILQIYSLFELEGHTPGLYNAM